MSEERELDCKPELELYVACTHKLARARRRNEGFVFGKGDRLYYIESNQSLATVACGGPVTEINERRPIHTYTTSVSTMVDEMKISHDKKWIAYYLKVDEILILDADTLQRHGAINTPYYFNAFAFGKDNHLLVLHGVSGITFDEYDVTTQLLVKKHKYANVSPADPIYECLYEPRSNTLSAWNMHNFYTILFEQEARVLEHRFEGVIIEAAAYEQGVICIITADMRLFRLDIASNKISEMTSDAGDFFIAYSREVTLDNNEKHELTVYKRYGMPFIYTLPSSCFCFLHISEDRRFCAYDIGHTMCIFAVQLYLFPFLVYKAPLGTKTPLELTSDGTLAGAGKFRKQLGRKATVARKGRNVYVNGTELAATLKTEQEAIKWHETLMAVILSQGMCKDEHELNGNYNFYLMQVARHHHGLFGLRISSDLLRVIFDYVTPV